MKMNPAKCKDMIVNFLHFNTSVLQPIIIGATRHPRPQAQVRAALTVALGQAVDLRRNSDAEAWSHSICIPP